MNESLSFPGTFFGVLIHPRKTFRSVIDHDTHFFVWPLILAYSVLAVTTPEFCFPFLAKMPLPAALILGASLVVIGSVVFFWVFGWVAYFVGKWMGGKGTFSEVMAAYIWCTPPAFIGILLNVIAVIPTWAKVFSGVTDEKLLLAPQMGWQSILVTLYSLSILWYVALMIVAISESHRISMWRSLALGLVVIILSIGVGIVLGVILVVSGHH